MRAGRLLQIVLLLQVHRSLTAAELASTCEVSVRTIYRDMAELSAAGIPVYGIARKDGGFRLVDGYQTRLTGLSEAEAKALFLTGAPAAAAALGNASEATAARRKLLAATKLPTERVHLDPTEWLATTHLPWLRDLHDAVWSDRLIRLRYGSAPRHVTIAPLGLVCKGTAWYLVALRDGEHRTYRVDRVRDLRRTADTFDRPEGFDLAAHWQEATTSYTDLFHRSTITLRLRGRALDRADWVQATQRTVGPPDRDGWATATFTVEDEDDALLAIALLGGEVRVVAPRRLRGKVVRAARAFAEVNGSA